MNIKEIPTANYITVSSLPDADFVINPYTGCPHKCIYCYAEFMKRFTNHTEDWGEFVDIKICDKSISLKSMSKNSSVLIGSVTDAYNPLEKKYKITQRILHELVDCDCKIEILTKSDLVLRDIDLISKMKNIKVGISLNTLDDKFRQKTEIRASSIEHRIEALKKLKEVNVSSYLFMSPIFPGITDFESIIEKLRDYVDYICFENLNLRGGYMPRVLDFIANGYPELLNLYDEIYRKKDIKYWEKLKTRIIEYCKNNGVKYRIYFYHDRIKKNAKK